MAGNTESAFIALWIYGAQAMVPADEDSATMAVAQGVPECSLYRADGRCHTQRQTKIAIRRHGRNVTRRSSALQLGGRSGFGEMKGGGLSSFTLAEHFYLLSRIDIR